MPSKAPSSFAVWAALALPLVCVALGALGLYGGEAGVAAHFALWRAAHPEARTLLELYTNWGNPALYLVFAGMLIAGVKRRRPELAGRALAYLAAQLVVSLAIERVLKIGIGRPRPGVGGPFEPFSLDAAHNAMPSGHTVEMTVQTASLALFAKSLALPLLLGLSLGLMGFSRMALGAHHPTDLLTGLLVGALGGLLCRRWAPTLAARVAPFLNRPDADKGAR
ncbi:MAG: hypothetical protein AUJ49_03050 [Desulfovibrionaceae bacterium CG1_02_65_16]|nr:MAG: hypothetical protein AUJ49_03050 [Desulfovibrionaceae bacterium CG1_02_65_16]